MVNSTATFNPDIHVEIGTLFIYKDTKEIYILCKTEIDENTAQCSVNLICLNDGNRYTSNVENVSLFSDLTGKNFVRRNVLKILSEFFDKEFFEIGKTIQVTYATVSNVVCLVLPERKY